MVHQSSGTTSSPSGDDGWGATPPPPAAASAATVRFGVAIGLTLLVVVPLFLLPTVAVMLVTSEIDVHPIVEHLMSSEQCAGCRAVVDQATAGLQRDAPLHGRFCTTGATDNTDRSIVKAAEAQLARRACTDGGGVVSGALPNCSGFIAEQRTALCEHAALASAARQHVLRKYNNIVGAAAASSAAFHLPASLSCPILPSFYRSAGAGLGAHNAGDASVAADAGTMPPLSAECIVRQHLFLIMGTGPVCARSACEGSMRVVDWLLVELLRILARNPSLQLLCFSVREVLGGVMLLGAQGGLLVLLLQMKRVCWELQSNVAAARRLLRRPSSPVLPSGSGGLKTPTTAMASARGGSHRSSAMATRSGAR